MTIKIYSTPTCSYCQMAKDFFTDKGLEYVDLDVSADEKARDEMISITGKLEVPVIDINGKIVVGFNREEIEKLLENLSQTQ